MSDALSLVEAWRGFSPCKGCNLLEGDERLLQPHKGRRLAHRCASFEEYIQDPDFTASDARRLHLGLLPVPFMGNLASARIFILMLNPGFDELDYFAEDSSREFRTALLDSLYQRIRPDDFPMVCLNPRFSWHGGYQCWTGKLNGVLRTLCRQRRCTWTDALRFLSRNVACIELFPYHSRSFGLPAPIKGSLRSAQLAKRYVHEVVLPRVAAGSAGIIVARKSREWDLPRHKNIVVYSPSESRAAHLTLGSPGGHILAKFLGLKP